MFNSFKDRFENRFEHRFEGSNRVTFEYGLIRRIAIKITQSALLFMLSRELWPRQRSTNADQRYTQHTLSEFITNEVNTFVECQWAVYVLG